MSTRKSKASSVIVVSIVVAALAAVLALAGCGSQAPRVTATSNSDNTVDIKLSSAKNGEMSFGEMVFKDDQAAQIEHNITGGSVIVEVLSVSSSKATATYTSEELSGEGSVTSDEINEGTYRIRVTAKQDNTSGTVHVKITKADKKSQAQLNASLDLSEDKSNPWTVTSSDPSIATVEQNGEVAAEDTTVRYKINGVAEGNATITFSKAASEYDDAATFSYVIHSDSENNVKVDSYDGPKKYKDTLS